MMLGANIRSFIQFLVLSTMAIWPKDIWSTFFDHHNHLVNS
jgi:hypothetical protein